MKVILRRLETYRSAENLKMQRMRKWYDPRWCWTDAKTGSLGFGVFYVIVDSVLIAMFTKWAKDFGKDYRPLPIVVQNHAAAVVASFYAVWILLDCILIAVTVQAVGLHGCQVWLLATTARYIHLVVDPALLVYTCMHVEQCVHVVAPSVLSFLFTLPLPLAQRVVQRYVRQERRKQQLALCISRLARPPAWMAQMAAEAEAEAAHGGDDEASGALARNLSDIKERDEDPHSPPATRGSGQGRAQHIVVDELGKGKRAQQQRWAGRGAGLGGEQAELFVAAHRLHGASDPAVDRAPSSGKLGLADPSEIVHHQRNERIQSSEKSQQKQQEMTEPWKRSTRHSTHSAHWGYGDQEEEKEHIEHRDHRANRESRKYSVHREEREPRGHRDPRERREQSARSKSSVHGRDAVHSSRWE